MRFFVHAQDCRPASRNSPSGSLENDRLAVPRGNARSHFCLSDHEHPVPTFFAGTGSMAISHDQRRRVQPVIGEIRYLKLLLQVPTRSPLTSFTTMSIAIVPGPQRNRFPVDLRVLRHLGQQLRGNIRLNGVFEGLRDSPAKVVTRPKMFTTPRCTPSLFVERDVAVLNLNGDRNQVPCRP